VFAESLQRAAKGENSTATELRATDEQSVDDVELLPRHGTEGVEGYVRVRSFTAVGSGFAVSRSPRYTQSPMKHHLHSELDARAGDEVQVTLDGVANVYLMDTENYENYVEDYDWEYYGGLAERSPYRIRVPHADHWHLVVDTDGLGSHSVNVLVKIVQA
jgi:hypothetical protein